METATSAALEIDTISECIITNSTKRPRVETSASPKKHLTSYKNLQVIIVVTVIRMYSPWEVK